MIKESRLIVGTIHLIRGNIDEELFLTKSNKYIVLIYPIFS